MGVNLDKLPRNRLDAFSDGVIAILITIMIMAFEPPQSSHIKDLIPIWPTALSYVLSFIYLGIYWNNHHHMFHTTAHINGRIMWANLHLLFWLSLFPFATAWLGKTRGSAWPTALYGLISFMAAIAFILLQHTIIQLQGVQSVLAQVKSQSYKEGWSLVIYLLAISLAFSMPWLSNTLYAVVALLWIIPDRRIEQLTNNS